MSTSAPDSLDARKAEPGMDVFDCAVPFKMAPLPGGFWTTRVNEEGEWTIVKYRISE